MALRNADKDASEQRDWISYSSNGAVATGAVLYLNGPVPYNYVLQSANAMTVGASGAPQISFGIYRAIVGAAATLISVGISNMVIANGASYTGTGFSGPSSLGYSGLAATGSTLLLGFRGDILVATTAGANTASNQLLINLVLQKTQDIVQMDGV